MRPTVTVKGSYIDVCSVVIVRDISVTPTLKQKSKVIQSCRSFIPTDKLCTCQLRAMLQ